MRIYDEALSGPEITAIVNPPALAAPDQITWLGQSVDLEVTNPGGAVTWSVAPSGAEIVLTPSGATATLNVTYDDIGTDVESYTVTAYIDTVEFASATIDVYDTACLAARLGLGDDRDGDRDDDCDVDLADLALMAAAWLTADTPKLAGELGVLDLDANGGLNPVDGTVWEAGDTYRLAFATKYTHPGDNTDPNIATYDARVTQAAADAGIGGAWMCVAETQNEPDMYVNIAQSGSNHAVLRMDSKVLWADLDAAGNMSAIENLLNITEEGDLCQAWQGYIAITGLGNTNPTVDPDGVLPDKYLLSMGDCNRDGYWFTPVGSTETSSTGLHYYAISTPLTIYEYSPNTDMFDFADIAVDWDDNWVPAVPQPRP